MKSATIREKKRKYNRYTTIRLEIVTAQFLRSMGKKGESYNDIIIRLIEKEKMQKIGFLIKKITA